MANKMETQIRVKFDCVSGKSRRYIIGKMGAKISGAVYITPPQEIPEQIILVFPEDKGGE